MISGLRYLWRDYRHFNRLCRLCRRSSQPQHRMERVTQQCHLQWSQTLLCATHNQAPRGTPRRRRHLNLQGVTSKRPHSEHATASPAIVDGKPSSEDQVTSGSSVQVFDESETQIPDSTTRVQPGDVETATAIEAEYLTPSARAAAVGLPTRPAGPAVPEGPTAQVTTEKQKQELDAVLGHQQFHLKIRNLLLPPMLKLVRKMRVLSQLRQKSPHFHL
ncbi:hypothetical protein N1851_033831 [Merluccius polli]|uniref:Uncharacterized protein n=1 Tax=Merluccius polli TaxID=89951 RepID=A0AA47M0T4_MERPO|nr:hypothetical protein N1851_033831 [Merluccius polli]